MKNGERLVQKPFLEPHKLHASLVHHLKSAKAVERHGLRARNRERLGYGHVFDMREPGGIFRQRDPETAFVLAGKQNFHAQPARLGHTVSGIPVFKHPGHTESAIRIVLQNGD